MTKHVLICCIAWLVSLHLIFAPRPAARAASGRPSTYYIDGFNGNDANSGLSYNHPWRHLAKLQTVHLEPGDSVLLKRGTAFFEQIVIQAIGSAAQPIVFDAYGKGCKPLLVAPAHCLYTIAVKNSSYLTLQHLEIVNKGAYRLAGRTGVKLICQDFGTAHQITLRSLYIHDVNGSLIKAKGGGSAVLIENKWQHKVSNFDSLLIENCVIQRTSRNGIIWHAPYQRDNWHPNTHVVVRSNLLEGVPGDGIVPIGCDHALIEYNVMRNCPEILPGSEAAAGIWPWSCDNTLIQFNEVSGQKSQWDAQGFDADYNCKHTMIKYNYSHDNYGGMVLICNNGEAIYPYNVGNSNTVVRNNLSINDGIRPKPARNKKMFSPAIHIAGPVRGTVIKNNIIYQKPVSNRLIDRRMMVADSWEGFADSSLIRRNVFYVSGKSHFEVPGKGYYRFLGNYYLGAFIKLPSDCAAHRSLAVFKKSTGLDKADGGIGLQELLTTKKVGDGAAIGHFVNKARINALLDKLFNPPGTHLGD